MLCLNFLSKGCLLTSNVLNNYAVNQKAHSCLDSGEIVLRLWWESADLGQAVALFAQLDRCSVSRLKDSA